MGLEKRTTMTPLGFVRPAAVSSKARVPAVPDLQLQVEEILASARRLWVRGRLRGGPFSLQPRRSTQRWWRRWWRKPASIALPALIRLETRISGHVFECEAPLEL